MMYSWIALSLFTTSDGSEDNNQTRANKGYSMVQTMGTCENTVAIYLFHYVKFEVVYIILVTVSIKV